MHPKTMQEIATAIKNVSKRHQISETNQSLHPVLRDLWVELGGEYKQEIF
jgi:hypothetical protein